MSGYPVIPSPSISAGPVPDHNHPLPKWLRRSLVIGATALLIFGITTLYVLARVTTVVRQGDRNTYQSCVQRHNNAAEAVRQFGGLLDSLQPTTDPAIRSFLMTARDGSQRTVAIQCKP